MGHLRMGVWKMLTYDRDAETRGVILWEHDHGDDGLGIASDKGHSRHVDCNGRRRS